MNVATLEAFHEELEKIKEAGMLRNVGTRILSSVKNYQIPKFMEGKGFFREVGQNAINTGKAFATPVDSFKAGLKNMVNPFTDKNSTWKDRAGAGLGLALSPVGSALELAPKEDPMGKGRSRLERLPGVIGDQVGSIIGAPFHMTGSIVGGAIGRGTANLAVKGVKTLAKPFKKKKAPDTPSLAEDRTSE